MTDPMTDPMTCCQAVRMQIAVIDDDIFVREAWGLLGHEIDAMTFDSPESFLAEIRRNPDLTSRFDAIVVDYNFGTRSRMSGADLAAVLKNMTSSPLILSTDTQPSEVRGVHLFDLQLDKNIIHWRAFSHLIPVRKDRRI